MPPERTAGSLAESVTHGVPLSSHGAGHAPSLVRGTACSACKRRKLRCDGVRPVCGGCSKSAEVHGDDPSAVPSCVYPEPKVRASPLGKLQRASLEAEIAELKATVAQLRAAAALAPGSATAPTAPVDLVAGTRSGFAGSPFSGTMAYDFSFEDQSSILSNPAAFLTGPQSRSVRLSGPPPSGEAWLPIMAGSVPGLSPIPAYSPSSSATSPFTPPDPLLELIYPGWPRDLPPPELTHRLVEVFFSRPHQCIGIVDAARIRAAMRLPPTSSAFPHTALLHVMCAIACLMVPDDFFRGEAPYWGTAKPGDYHVARCKIAIEASLNATSLFHIAQVYGLLCFWLYSQARWIELWQYCGLATRITTPLGLNHVRAASDSAADPAAAPYEPHLLADTDDEAHLRERALTFWLGAFVADRFASASTGWACSLDKVDVTTVVPSEGQPYPRGESVAASPNSPHNPAFFLAHTQGCGPVQLFIKAVVLLGDVVQYQHRAPHASRTVSGFALNDKISDLRLTDSFKRLDANVQGFMASIPREYQFLHRPLGAGIDDVLSETRLCLVHGMAHTSSILLHEPYVATLDEAEPSLVRCVESANAIQQSIHLILGTSYDIALFSPFFTYVVACAGRTFVRLIALKLVKGVQHGVGELRGNIDTILNVLKAHRTPLGDNAHAQLSSMVADPLRCLPRPFLPLATVLAPNPTYRVPTAPLRTPCVRGPEPAEEAAVATGAHSASEESRGVFELLEGDAVGGAGAHARPEGATYDSGGGQYLDAATGDGGAEWYAAEGLAGLEQVLQMQ